MSLIHIDEDEYKDLLRERDLYADAVRNLEGTLAKERHERDELVKGLVKHLASNTPVE